MVTLSIMLGALILLILLVFGLETLAFFRNSRAADLQWSGFVPQKLAGFGSVKTLKITPLIEWYVSDKTVSGEAGVSWLVQADETTILMDVGLNLKGEHPSPLLRNMQNLNLSLQDVPYVFITHLHMDHTGGLAHQKKRTFTPSAAKIDLSHVTAFVPTPMKHPTAEVRFIDRGDPGDFEVPRAPLQGASNFPCLSG